MAIVIEDIKRNLVGKKVKVTNVSGSVTIFKKITDTVDAFTALENPEIRSGAKDNLLYVVEGFVESTSDKYVSNAVSSKIKNRLKIQMYIYPDTEVLPIEESTWKSYSHFF